MANELQNAALDELDQAMLDAYNEYASICVESWASFEGTPGQMVIVKKHVMPVALEHASQARPNWPESATPDQYEDGLYNCYDSEVMSAAFSETIGEVTGQMYSLWEDASFLQSEHAMLARGPNAGPHSTHPVWRG